MSRISVAVASGGRRSDAHTYRDGGTPPPGHGPDCRVVAEFTLDPTTGRHLARPIVMTECAPGCPQRRSMFDLKSVLRYLHKRCGHVRTRKAE